MRRRPCRFRSNKQHPRTSHTARYSRTKSRHSSRRSQARAMHRRWRRALHAVSGHHRLGPSCCLVRRSPCRRHRRRGRHTERFRRAAPHRPTRRFAEAARGRAHHSSWAHREPVWHRRGAIRPLRQEPQRRAEPDASAAPAWSTMLSVAASVMRFFKARQPRATVCAGTARGYRRVPATTATLGTRRNSNWNSIFGRAAADQLPRQEFAKNMPRIRRAARFTFASSTPQRSTGTAGPMENTT